MTEVLTKPAEKTKEPMISFTARSVTGIEAIEVEFQRSTPVDAVARSLAEMMSMPDDVPYGLRNDGDSSYLEDLPIGDQIAPGSVLSLTPKTHLGAHLGAHPGDLRG